MAQACAICGVYCDRMNLLLIVAITVAVLIVLALLSSGRRVFRHAGRPPLMEVMQYRGAKLREPFDEPEARWHAHALRVCIACPSRKICEEQLRANRPSSSYAVCPNARYIDCVRGGGLTFS